MGLTIDSEFKERKLYWLHWCVIFSDKWTQVWRTTCWTHSEISEYIARCQTES